MSNKKSGGAKASGDIRAKAADVKAAEPAVEAEQAVAVDEAPTYGLRDFVRASDKIFSESYGPDLITAALKLGGKDAYTKAEAQELVRAFANKEV